MVETIRLESGHTLTGIVGSNPTLSARLNPHKMRVFLSTDVQAAVSGMGVYIPSSCPDKNAGPVSPGPLSK